MIAMMKYTVKVLIIIVIIESWQSAVQTMYFIIVDFPDNILHHKFLVNAYSKELTFFFCLRASCSAANDFLRSDGIEFSLFIRYIICI